MRSRWHKLLLACVFVLSGCILSGCIVEAPGSDSEKGRTAEASTTGPRTAASSPAGAQGAPAAVAKVGANFEDKVELLGATLQPGQVVPGEATRVTAYFKVTGKLTADYMVFVHVEDPDGRIERTNVDHKPVGGTRPTSQWQVGETIRDEFPLYVAPGSNLRAINVWIGLWDPKTDSRLKLKNTTQVRNDGKDRVLLATVPVAQ